VHCVIVGTQAVAQLSEFVRPLLKRREVVSMLKAWEVANLALLALKVGLRVHGCEIVRWHTVILDSLKKMCTDAVRVTVSVLQGEVIVLVGVFVVAGDCWAEVLKGSHQQVVQKELRVFAHALAGGVGRSRVRGVPGLQGFACRVVVDQSPGAGVRSHVDSQIEAGHHLFGRFHEAQKAGALVCMVGILLDRGTGLHLGEVETGAASRHDFGSDNDPKKKKTKKFRCAN
jgi:hypothetical protein